MDHTDKRELMEMQEAFPSTFADNMDGPLVNKGGSGSNQNLLRSVNEVSMVRTSLSSTLLMTLPALNKSSKPFIPRKDISEMEGKLSLLLFSWGREGGIHCPMISLPICTAEKSKARRILLLNATPPFSLKSLLIASGWTGKIKCYKWREI